MEIEPQTAAGWASVLTGGILALGYALRRLLRYWAEGEGDKAEINAVKTWREEARLQRERADIAFTERNAAMRELGELRGRVTYLTTHVATLESQVERLEQRLDSLLRGSDG